MHTYVYIYVYISVGKEKQMLDGLDCTGSGGVTENNSRGRADDSTSRAENRVSSLSLSHSHGDLITAIRGRKRFLLSSRSIERSRP